MQYQARAQMDAPKHNPLKQGLKLCCNPSGKSS